MSKLLREILAEFEDIDVSVLTSPTDKIKNSYHVVGRATEEQKKLFHMGNKLDGTRMISFLELVMNVVKGVRSKEDIQASGIEERFREYNLLKNKCDIIDSLFLESVQRTFPELIGKEHVEVGEDWQVYWEEDSSHPCGIVSASISLLVPSPDSLN